MSPDFGLSTNHLWFLAKVYNVITATICGNGLGILNSTAPSKFILLAKEHASIEKNKSSILQSEVANRFASQYKFVTDILHRKDKIEFDDVVFSPYFKFSKDPDKKNKEVKNIYYLFGNLKINDTPVHEAQEKLKNYYESIINN